jgi:trehalose 6-phosphate phosphatase
VHAPHVAVLSDFDGTLAPIVADPARAAALPGSVETLHRLASRLDVVAVISGRPAEFLASRLWPAHPGAEPSRLRAYGLYGIEPVVPPGRAGAPGEPSPDLTRWRAAVDAAVRALEASMPPDTLLERKGLSVGLHWRSAPDEETSVLAVADAVATEHGLVLHRGRMAAELVPPLPVDKGVVVGRLVEGLQAACFVGDDLGDLPAFEALGARAATNGFVALRVAVASPESPPDLLGRADLVVDGPPEALAFLQAIEAALD